MSGVDGKDGVMSPAELKPLLLLSKREPVNCAIGLTRDKQGAILLDKRAKPRKVAALFKKAAQGKKIELEASTVRFGRASVDTERDGSLVLFTVNKDAPAALRVKLLEQLKKAGFSKCEISVDAALEDEPEDEASADAPDGAAGVHGRADGPAEAAAPPQTATPPADATPASASADQAAPTAAQAGAGASSAAPEAPQAASAAGPDAEALRTRLTDLVKRMVAALASNPPGGDAMKTAAKAAQASLKSGDLASAARDTDSLERMLGGSQAAASAPAAEAGAGHHPMGSPVFAKARDAWVATRAKVQGEVDGLFHAVSDSLKGHGAASPFETAFKAKIGPAMDQLDHSLSAKLDEVANNTDAGAHGKLVGEAQQILSRYQSYLSREKMLTEIDHNPYRPLAVGKTLQASLGALGKALQAPAGGQA